MTGAPAISRTKRALPQFKDGVATHEIRFDGELVGEQGNVALAGAFIKGALAHFDGEPRSATPYGDDRTTRNGVTFARAFARAWGHGYEAAQKHLAKEAT